MLKIEEDIIARILSQDTVRQLVGRNPHLTAGDDQLAIRTGLVLKDDPYPCIEVNLVTIEHEKDLQECSGLAHGTLEIRCMAFDKPSAWALRNAVAYDGGDPTDEERTTGLDRYRDISKWIWKVGLRRDEIDVRDLPPDATDRALWFIDTTYNVEFRERL